MWKFLFERWHGAQCRGVWMWLAVASWLGVADLEASPLLGWSPGAVWLALAALSCLKATLLWLLYLVARPKRWSRFLMIGIIALYSLMCVTNGVVYTIYGFGISHRLMAALAQTNSRETMEFFPVLLPNVGTALTRRGLLLALLAGYGFYIEIRRISAREFFWLVGTVSVAGAVATAFAMAGMGQGRNLFLMSVRVPKNIIESRREMRAMDELMRSLRPLPDAASVHSSQDAATIVMVIGESATTEHWGLYGYPLPTTPRLAAMKDSLIVFTDALGSSTTTAVNMERILTLMNDDSPGEWYEYPMLLDIFNAAGYRTFWLSNQERMGVWSNSSGAMASRASRVKYVGTQSSEDALEYRYDEVLLPEYRLALVDTARAKQITLHLMGSHNEYRLRYPASFSRFKAEDERGLHRQKWINDRKLRTIAEYDNSILYTDSILGEVIGAVARDPKPAIFVYFSDHGENVYSDRDFIGRDRRHMQVPMVVYANAAYRRAFPERVERLKAACGKAFSTSGISYLLMGLSGTEYNGYDATRDISSPSYRQRPRYVDREAIDE